MNKFILSAFVALFCTQLLSAQCIQFTCPTQTDTICDLLDNNPQFWNEAYWLDPTINSHDLSEAPADLQFQVIDTCGGATLAYELLLDLDNDGVLESRISSDSVQLPGKVFYDNISTPGGTLRVFDERPVTDSLKYRFSLEQTSVGDTITGRLRWNTLQAGDVYSDALLPVGKHRIVWYIRTATTVDTCGRDFRIRDCKPPVVVCIGNLSLTRPIPIPFPLVFIQVADILQSAQDNVTPSGQLQFGLARPEQNTGVFPTNPDGTPVTSLYFTCTNLGTNTIQLWVKDQAGNLAFCETSIIIDNSLYGCQYDPYSTRSACAYTAAPRDLIDYVDFALYGTAPGAPPIASVFPGIPFPGCWYSTFFTPSATNFVLTPTKDVNHINGVSTYDLVLLSKHILGIEPFTSPYKMIAADANKSNTITTFDIVELRKLVLGIYTELPNNTSWRFIDKDYVFPNPGNPWAAVFPENKKFIIMELQSNIEFVGVKIGDFNGNAIANTLFDEIVETRSLFNLTLPDLSLRAGTTTDIPLQISEAAQWLGFQASLQFDPQNVEIEIVDSKSLPDFDASSWAKPQPGRLNVSWFAAQPQTLVPGENLLTLRVHARTDVRLRDALTLDNKLLRAEAYSDQEVAQNLSLQFREQPTLAENTAIFPAQPNPTTAGTLIPLRLQSAEKVILEVFDATGKRVFQQANSLAAGSQMIEIPAGVLQSLGVYTWRVQAGGVVQAGKVVRQ